MMSKPTAVIEGQDWKEELPASVEVVRAIVRTADIAGDFEFAIRQPDGTRLLALALKKEWTLKIFGPNGNDGARAVRRDSGLAGTVQYWTMIRALRSSKHTIFSAPEAERIVLEFLAYGTRPKQADWINFPPKA